MRVFLTLNNVKINMNIYDDLAKGKKFCFYKYTFEKKFK
jgi:hypothetical protein